MRARLCTSLLVATSMLGAVTCRASGAAGCEKWLVDGNRAIEEAPVAQRWDKTLELLAQGCEVVPAGLRAGAERSLGKSRPEQLRAILEASSSYFSQECVASDPAMPASKLLHVCLGSDYPRGEFASMLENIDAATYLYGKALQRELEQAGLYKEHGQRVLANFFLSNAVSREAGRAQ